MSQPQSIARAYDNLLAVIKADAQMAAFATATLGGDLVIVEGNVAIANILPKEMPALVGELGDGQNTPEGFVIGNASQPPQFDLYASLVWNQNDRVAALRARLALPDLMIRAVMRNTGLDLQDGDGAAVDWAYVSEWISSRGDRATAPKQWMQFKVRCGTQVEA